MPTFSYRALGRDGKEVRGVLQAETETAAATRVRDSYPVLLSISREAEKKKQTSLLQMEIGNKRIRTKDLPFSVPSLPSLSAQECPYPVPCRCWRDSVVINVCAGSWRKRPQRSLQEAPWRQLWRSTRTLSAYLY